MNEDQKTESENELRDRIRRNDFKTPQERREAQQKLRQLEGFGKYPQVADGEVDMVELDRLRKENKTLLDEKKELKTAIEKAGDTIRETKEQLQAAQKVNTENEQEIAALKEQLQAAQKEIGISPGDNPEGAPGEQAEHPTEGGEDAPPVTEPGEAHQ